MSWEARAKYKTFLISHDGDDSTFLISYDRHDNTAFRSLLIEQAQSYCLRRPKGSEHTPILVVVLRFDTLGNARD